MNIRTITMLICFGLATTAAAQGTPGGKSASSGGSSKSQLSEIRSLVHELQARTEKLRDLITVYRSLAEDKPQSGYGSDEAKKEYEANLAKWNMALERQLRRIDEARAAVVETTQRLDQTTNGQVLATSLGKDVANARNDAEAQRTLAEQMLAKGKATMARTSKPAKKAEPEKPAPPIPDDL